MATLDPLLRAVVDHGMEALVLEPGELPRLARNGTLREVTRTRLDGTAIVRLARELAPGKAPEPEAGAWEFEYRMDGRPFRFAGTRSPDGWRFRAEVTNEGTDANGHGNGHGPGAEAGHEHRRAPAPAPLPVQAPVHADPRAAMDHLLRQLVELRGSDLHLSPGQPIRMRIDGDLGPVGTETPGPERTQELLRAVSPEARLAEFDADCDADFGYEIPGLARFRVNLFRDRHGMGAVFRQIPETIPSAEDLGLPKPVRELAQLPKGLVLVTGPTGSGKSTTLAAILDLVNRTRPDHLITIEDPVEFVHPSKRAMVNQREVGDHTRSFARALRAALREDPDVVLVGE
ncbi:MAG TPA: ATPase, T2SS/T4P/T4SS family, partial [Thermoanaerobaculia bacterium]|nr:ATPase, T2SS/T4P/T4SS family [Thermoanaerobaculia bacterium]